MSIKLNGKYSFTWKIDNYSLCPQKRGEFLSSPLFTAENVGNSVWSLFLFPKGTDENSNEYVSLYITRVLNDTLDDVIDADVNAKIVDPDGGILAMHKTSNASFDRGKSWGAPMLIKIDKLAQAMEKWKEDALILCCTIVNRKELNSIGQTKIEADRSIFKWNIETQDGVIQPTQKEISMCDVSIFQIDLGSSDENIKLSISMKDLANLPKTVSCKISLLNINGSEFDSKRAVHVFESDIIGSIWEFPTFLSVKDIVKNKDSLFKNGTFTLLFEFSSLKNANPIYVVNPICNNYTQKHNIWRLRQDLLNMYRYKLHSDIELNVEGKIFNAHKNVLAARSPVFSAMFSQDMLESRTSVIKISDVEANQFESFLEYVYTGKVDNMNYEVASKLTIIADKYQLQELTIHCSFVLRSHLNIENLCEVLTLAEMIDYKPLRVFAFDYIVEHAKEILTSCEWVKWTENNIKLAAELMSNIAVSFEMVPKKFNK